MSSIAARTPVATARPPHWTFRSVFRAWRSRTRAHRGIHVAIEHLADIPPT